MVTADTVEYYPREDIAISSELVDGVEESHIILDPARLTPFVDDLHHTFVAMYSRAAERPSTTLTELFAILTLCLGAGGLTLLISRWKIPEDPNASSRILYDTIKEHPGATLAKLQRLTGYSRGSVSNNLCWMEKAANIRKYVRDGHTRYYLINVVPNKIEGFLRKIAAQEKPKKIFEAIIDTPGISQKELQQTTGIAKTTLQWHLTQLAKYEAVKRTRDKNTLHYSVIPDCVLLYNHILENGKQNKPPQTTTAAPEETIPGKDISESTRNIERIPEANINAGTGISDN